MILGGALVVLGMIALGSVVIASLAAALVIGALLSLRDGRSDRSVLVQWLERVFLSSFPASCRLSSGFCFFEPRAGPLALTLLVACFLMVGGVFKIVAAVSYRFAAWGWALASGIVDLILGS